MPRLFLVRLAPPIRGASVANLPLRIAHVLLRHANLLLRAAHFLLRVAHCLRRLALRLLDGFADSLADILCHG